MNKIIRNSLSSILLLVLSACNLFGPPSAAVFENSVLRLTVETRGNTTTFSQAGENIRFRYTITNTGASRLAEPVRVTDPPRDVRCPGLAEVGNQDIFLDKDESITCIADYTVTESDVTTGTIISVATATAGGVTSNQATFTLTRGSAQTSSVLQLAKSASSQTYGAVDQTITFNFNITNTGTTPLGPAQFTISDPKLGAPFNCGPPDTTIQPGQSLPCSIDYKTTSADMVLANITNSATASGAGQTSAPASVTVTNLVAPATQTPPTPATAAPPSNLSPGSTVPHPVAVGEWLIQIVRCYGADLDEVIGANPQIADPDFILPSMVVTVPRIGSRSRIYGPPCITFYNVQSNDTWESIAQKFNADLTVLRLVNPGALTGGRSLKIPLNSAGGGGVSVTAAPPTSVTPGNTAPSAMRITFDPGSTTASRIGLINAGERIQYIVTAAPGQLLTINLQATANEMTLGVNNPNGLALKPSDSNYTWSATVTTAGDHTINLTSLTGGSKSYTLQVSLTNPTAATPTATQTPSTPAP
jgi:LysM repeat protein